MKTYEKPYPPMTSRASGRAICVAAIGTHGNDWLCTRERDHEGNHEAGNMAGQKMAEWK